MYTCKNGESERFMKIVIVVDGGIVSEVYSEVNDIEVVVIDTEDRYDPEMKDTYEKVMDQIDQGLEQGTLTDILNTHVEIRN